MLEMLERHMDEVTALVLFGIGFTTLLLNKNLFKKIIGFSMMDSGIYLFLASYGYIESRVAPRHYGNPLPAGLVLTGIVVGVSVTAIMLGLTVRLYRRYGTLDMDEIAELVRKEGK